MLIFGDELFEYVELFEEFLDEMDWILLISLFGIVYVFLYLLDDFVICFDVNLRYWREEVVNELFCRMRKRSKYIIFGIGFIIGEIFEIIKIEL